MVLALLHERYNAAVCSMYFDDAVNLASEPHDSNARMNHLRKKKERKKGLNREHWYGAGQIPFEGQVRTILTTLEC